MAAAAAAVKTCRWCDASSDVAEFPDRSAACGPCKNTWSQIRHSIGINYRPHGFHYLRLQPMPAQRNALAALQAFKQLQNRGSDFP